METTRRRFLKTAPLAAVAVTVPAIAARDQSEQPMDRIFRLTREMSEAMNDFPMMGTVWAVTVYPASTGQVHQTFTQLSPRAI